MRYVLNNSETLNEYQLIAIGKLKNANIIKVKIDVDYSIDYESKSEEDILLAY